LNPTSQELAVPPTPNRADNVRPLPGANPHFDPRRHPRTSRWRIAIFALLPIVAVAAGAAWYWLHPKTDPAARFVTATIATGDVEDTVTALGNLQPKNYVDVGAQVSGQLMRINVAIGQKVKAGSLLAEIDPTILEAKVTADQAALASLQAQLVDKQAQLDLAQKQLKRQQNMMSDNATSQDALQIAATTVQSNRAQIAALQAQAKQAQSTLDADRASLGYTKIYAPMDGTVVSLTAQQGQTLNASQTTPLILRIADLATMTVWTQVSEADVPRLKVGMAAYFTTLGDQEHRWQGKLLQILPTPDVVNNVVLYPALFEVKNPDGKLMTQMSAQVFFVVDSVKNAVTVPVAALRPVKGDVAGARKPDSPDAKPYTVRVLGADSKETRRPVWVGVMNRVSAEVLSGLQPGDVVIVGRHSADDDGGPSTAGTTKNKSGSTNPMRRIL
jgi:macrolide-specific efflux system membrane fusion protein